MDSEKIINGKNCEILEQHCLDTCEKLSCEYYMPDEIRYLKTKDNFQYSLLHLNIRSLNKHHDHLVSLLATLDQ